MTDWNMTASQKKIKFFDDSQDELYERIELIEEKLAYGDLDYGRYSTLIKHLNQLKLYTNANVNLKSILLSLVLQFSDNQVRI